jgi:GntR family transcriptional regulator
MNSEVRMTQSQAVPYALPLYEQVYQILRSRITSGEWKPQGLVPSEMVLAQELGVSVGTVRKAMSRLSRENLVFRERGRGTFVKGNDEWASSTSFKLFDPSGQAIAPAVEIVDAAVGVAVPFEVQQLRIGRFASTRVMRIKRAWTAGGTLLARELIAVEASRFPELSDALKSGLPALAGVYADLVHARVERVIWQIDSSASPDDSAASSKSGGQKGATTLRLNRLAYDARGLPLEMCRFEFFMENCLLQLSD